MILCWKMVDCSFWWSQDLLHESPFKSSLLSIPEKDSVHLGLKKSCIFRCFSDRNISFFFCEPKQPWVTWHHWGWCMSSFAFYDSTFILTKRDMCVVWGPHVNIPSELSLLRVCTFTLAYVCAYACAGCGGCVTMWSTYATLKCASWWSLPWAASPWQLRTPCKPTHHATTWVGLTSRLHK